MDSEELKRREALALEAIKSDRFPNDFASHHIEYLEPAYWQKHLQTDSPSEEQVLGLLRLDEGFDGDLDTLDFFLPEGVSNYLLCVCFDEAGQVESIEMES